MKRYCIDFEFNDKYIEQCILECLCNKWKRKDVSYFLAEYGQKLGVFDINFDKHIIAKTINKYIIEKGKEEFIDLIKKISQDILKEIKSRSITLKPIVYQERYDRCSKKTRKIGIASIKQQVYDYIAVNSAKEMFMAKIYVYQCASIKGRGQLYGVKAIKKWIKKSRCKTRYAFKCDIKKYYPSVDQKILRELLKRDIKNKEIIYIMYTLLDTYQEGLCIGSYLSQFLANYYLSYACHYLTENAFIDRKSRKDKKVKKIRLISHVLIYMDDIIIFGSNKKHLKRASMLLEKYLEKKLGLHLKEKKELFDTRSRPIDMMGYIIYHDHIEIRKHIFLKMRKLFIKYKDTNKKMSIEDARALLSYKGYLDHSNSEKFKIKYKTKRTLDIARRVVSQYDRRIYRKAA